MLPIYLI